MIETIAQPNRAALAYEQAEVVLCSGEHRVEGIDPTVTRHPRENVKPKHPSSPPMTLGNIRALCVRLIALCLISLCPTVAHSEDQDDYVHISEEAYAALQCSVFAAHARYDLEENRFFSYGLERARIVIQAARAGRVSLEDFARMRFAWPLALRAWNFQRQDTSTDFVAGQVYEMIWADTTGDLGDRSRDKATYQEPAQEQFSGHNCTLLAK
jgi:hypothetical protein